MSIRHLHDRFTIDSHSYICQPYHINGGMASLHVGKYTAIAINLRVDLGYQHNYKNVTSFPMHILKEGVPSNLWCKGDIHVLNDCWIGENVTLMGGVTIGNGAIIGANTTVRRDVLPYEIYIGGDYSYYQKGLRPTTDQSKKFRFDEKTRERLLELAWWDWEESRILANAELLAQPDIERFLNEHI